MLSCHLNVPVCRHAPCVSGKPSHTNVPASMAHSSDHHCTQTCKARNYGEQTFWPSLARYVEDDHATPIPFKLHCLTCDTGDSCTSCSARQSTCNKQMPLAAQMVSNIGRVRGPSHCTISHATPATPAHGALPIRAIAASCLWPHGWALTTDVAPPCAHTSTPLNSVCVCVCVPWHASFQHASGTTA